jgi:hypothetical protein
MFLLLENNQIPCDALLFDDYVYPVIPWFHGRKWYPRSSIFNSFHTWQTTTFGEFPRCCI